MYPLFLWAPSPKHPLLPGAGALLVGKVAAAGPECEWPTLAAFHRNPDLRDRRGRKQVGVAPGSWKGGTGHLKGGAEGGCGLESGLLESKPCSTDLVMALRAPLPVRIHLGSQRQPPPKAPLHLLM